MEPMTYDPAAPELPLQDSQVNGGGDADPREQHAAEMLERAVERSEPSPPPADAPAPRATRQEAAPEPPPAALPPVPPAPRWAGDPRLHPASQGFIGRIQDRAQVRAQHELASRLQRAADQIQAGPPQPAAPGDPEPDFDADPPAWYRWQTRQTVQEAIGPVAAFVQQQTAREQQDRQVWEENQQREQFNQAMSAEMDYARQTYAATPEGALFDERFDWWVNDVTVPGLVANGIPPAKAHEMARIGMQAYVDFSTRNGINPAVFIDNLIRQQVGAVAGFLMDAGVMPAGQQPRQPAARRQANPEIASLREIGAGAGSVAGVLSQTTAPGSSGGGIAAVMADPSVDNIRAWANEEYGGDLKKATSALRRAVATAQSSAR